MLPTGRSAGLPTAARPLMNGRLGNVAVAAVMAATGGSGLNGQSVVIDDRVKCPACEITVSDSVILRSDVAVVSFTDRPIPSVAELPDGRFVAGPMVGDHRIAVFRPDGGFQLALGREGNGPGEFLGYRANVRLRTDRAGVLHAAQRNRWFVVRLDGADVTVEGVRMDVIAGDAVPVGDHLYVQAEVTGQDGRSSPIQIVDRQGRAVRGIGSDDPPAPLPSPFRSFRYLSASASGDGLWSARLNRFEVRRFSTSGREELMVTRESEWFEPYDGLLRGELLQVPQRPRVQAIHETVDGKLWVAVTHGSTSFEPVRTAESGGERRVVEDYDLNRLLDTTVEVIDVEAGVVLARRTFDHMVQFVSTYSGVKAYTVRADPSGDYSILIRSLDLIGLE